MAEYAVNLNAGKTDEKGMFRLLGKIFNQSGVIESTAMTVAAQGTPDMTVKVSGSTASDNAVFINSSGDTYHGWNTANKNVTITANATGANRYDAIVAYIDTAAGSATANNPAGLKFIAVRSTNTSPATGGDITGSAVGSNPYIRLADVLVGNGVISINSGNITDTRPFAKPRSASTQTFTDSAADDGTTQAVSAGAWTDVTNLSQTVTTSGGNVRVTFSIPASNTVGGGTSLFRILDGSTTKHKFAFNPGATGVIVPVTCSVLLTSIASGSHTFKVQVQQLAGGGTTVTLRTGQATIDVEERAS